MKMNYVLIVISTAITCTSCVHYYYAPNSNNVPLFKEKDEARVAVQYVETGGDENLESAKGVELQTAYALSKHAAVQLNFLSAGTSNEDGSGNGTYIEAAGGYFKPIGKKKKFVFETYAGFGLGGVTNHFIYGGNGDVKTSIAKGFVQPSIGFASRYFSAALSSRFSLVTLTYRSSSIDEIDHQEDFTFLNTLKGGKSYFFWEPGLMLRGGFREVQIELQLTENTTNDGSILIATSSASIGLFFPIAAKKKK